MARLSPEERFWSKVDKGDGSGCWIWTANLRQGYGVFRLGALRPAHRVAWEWAKGPVPDGLPLDHLCRNRACVRPSHLEPVTHRENILRGNGFSGRNARKTHCKRGHPLSGENLEPYALSKGRRICKICQLAKQRAYDRRHRLSQAVRYDASRHCAWR